MKVSKEVTHVGTINVTISETPDLSKMFKIADGSLVVKSCCSSSKHCEKNHEDKFTNRYFGIYGEDVDSVVWGDLEITIGHEMNYRNTDCSSDISGTIYQRLDLILKKIRAFKADHNDFYETV